MTSPFYFRMTVPTVLVSILLLTSGVVAAWYVQRLQSRNAELVAREVYGMLAAEHLNIEMRDIRHALHMLVKTGGSEYLESISELHQTATSLLAEAKRLSRTPRERELIGIVESGYERFFREYNRITGPGFSGNVRSELEKLLQVTLDEEVLRPTSDYVLYSRQVVEGTTQDSQVMANRIRWGLLLLGGCGAIGGLVAGFGIAHGINRSIVQLQVPLRGAAGKLNEVIGPVSVSVNGGFEALEGVLRQIDNHVGLVVERLQQREREVMRAEQLAALGQLAAGIAHELRNPLMPVKFMVQAAAETGQGLHGRDLVVIDHEITRLDESIQAFLDFARPPQPDKTNVDMRAVLEQTIQLVAPRAQGQNVSIRRRLPPSPTEVEADAGQLRQLMLNLLLNALDALPDGGVIEAVIDVAQNRKPFPDEGGGSDRPTTSAEMIALRIADSGCGLPPELSDRIFEPFVSTKETGIGLGLSICRRIAEAHGGSVTAENRLQGGAEFILSLPRARDASGMGTSQRGKIDAIEVDRTAEEE